MANQKAQRSEIELPFLLNLQEDKPRVASDFRSAEHLNAPYLNGMHMPLWKKEATYSGTRPVWDYKNNEYRIEDGFLTKNGKDLFAVENKHFKREDVTEEFSQYIAFDFSEDGQLAKMEWDTATKSVKFTFGNGVMFQNNIFVNGVLLGARVRVISNTAIGVLIYEVGNKNYMLYMNLTANRKVTRDLVWCTAQPKRSVDGAFDIAEQPLKNPAPLINIANPLPNVYAVSMLSSSGEVLYTRREGYYTFVDINGTYIDGKDWKAANGSSTETIKNYQTSNFLFSYQTSTMQELLTVHNRNGKWYYNNNPTVEVPDSQSIAFGPTMISDTFTYEGVVYQCYNVIRYTNRIILNSSVDNLYGKAASIKINLSDGHSLSNTYTNNTVSFDHSEVSWLSSKIKPASGILTYNSQPYSIVDFSKVYTITTDTTPTTKQAAYITTPNVFLDNGNMYSWYTIPSASEDSSLFAITFPKDSLIVESAKLKSINTTNKTFTFDIIEAHLVNDYSLYGRSNSIAIGQNFWSSSLKTNSAGVRTPYQTYIQKETAEKFSETVKYTEYSNSNCTDMLYYSGTCPRNDHVFYKYASASSEDIAWFNPGGFRAPLKDNWYILYYIDASGSVSMQGLSYADDVNKMGTLVTPFASISDTEYIAASKDFLVYCDSHNKYYKVSIEDCAKLSSIIDNRFIVINTTSYWNMWDAMDNRKYHYASDYNNRTKLGLTRTTYRADPLKYYTLIDRRKYATAINSNYNLLPRLPVTSMIPASFALGHILSNFIMTDYIHTNNCIADGARELQPIDVFLQGTLATDTNIAYNTSIRATTNGDQFFRNANISDTSFSDSKSIMFITDIFTTFINGAGNNDFAVEGVAKYPLIYNNQNKPMFLYNFVSGIDVDNVRWFFIIQGQYYAIIGNKLYAMIYSNGMISQSDAIVDIRDLKYVGNTSAIAFFVNPYTKQMYSFTGDANMQQLFDAGKYHFKWDESGEDLYHFYDESTQSVYIGTEEGLLVLGPQNTYVLEDYKNVEDIEFVDGNIHIVEPNKTTSLRYYHDKDDFEALPIQLETSFFGLGANEITSIDRWNITFYDPDHRDMDIYLQVRSLTDVSTMAEEKKIHINTNDWDKWSHSKLISFTPSIIKGQGIRLSIKSPAAIQKIVPHVMDNKISTPVNNKFSV